MNAVVPCEHLRVVEALEELWRRRSGRDGFIAEGHGGCRTFAEMIEAGLERDQRVVGAACACKDAKLAVRFCESDQQLAGTEDPLIERVGPDFRTDVIQLGLLDWDDPFDDDQCLRHTRTVFA